MSLNKLLGEIRAAASQPGGLALRAVAAMTAGEPNLLHALEAASVPHWWEEWSLTYLLDDDLSPDANYWNNRLKSLSVVEPFLSVEGSHNVHEVTRLAIRQRLYEEGRLALLSSRAMRSILVYGVGHNTSLIIEFLYHQLVAEPEKGAESLEILWRDWDDNDRWTPLLDLAAMLEEVMPFLSPVPRARALLRWIFIRSRRTPISQMAEPAMRCLKLFRELQDEKAQGDILQLLGEISQSRGNVMGAYQFYYEAEQIFRKFFDLNSSNPSSRGDLLEALRNLGDIAKSQGDLLEASRLHGESMGMALHLVQLYPSDIKWQEELATSYARFGDLAEEQGDLTGALRFLKKGLNIVKSLAENHPDNAERQKDLSVYINKLGDLALGQGNLPGARLFYAESKSILERVCAIDPANVWRQRELAAALGKLGDVYLDEAGGLDDSWAYYSESKKMIEQLVALDPDNTLWQLDLSISLSKLGILSQAKHDAVAALKFTTASKEISDRLANSDPANATWQHRLSITLGRLGDLASERNYFAGALRSYKEGRDICLRLVKSDGSNTRWQRSLSVCYGKLGELAHHAKSDFAGALRFFRESNRIAEQLAERDPSNALWQRDLAISYKRMADPLRGMGKLSEAMVWRRKSHDILVALKRGGCHLNPHDEDLLKELKVSLRSSER